MKNNISHLGLKGCIPLCLAHAIKPYGFTKMLELLGRGKAKASIKVAPRKPYRNMLKRFGIEWKGHTQSK
jgi:hypothetical protein